MTDEDRIRAAREGMQDIGLHDASIDRISWLPGSDVLLQFDDLHTCHTAPDGKPEVWSSAGVLRFVDVNTFHIEGTDEKGGAWIYRASFFDADGSTLRLGFAVGTLTSIARVEIDFGFGFEMRIACSGMVWDSLDPVRKTGDWVD